TRLDDRDPVVGRALARAHAGLGRLGRDRLVREDSDPDLAAALDVARHRDPGRLDLPGVDPGRRERLQAELAEGDRVAGGSLAAAVAAVLLAVLDPLRHQHQAGSCPCGAPACGSGWTSTPPAIRSGSPVSRTRPSSAEA